METSSPDPLHRPLWERLYSTRPITAAAVIVGWLGMYLAYQRHWSGFVLALVTTGLTLLALRRGQVLSEQRRASLRAALEAQAARNRELERLSHLAATLLAGYDLHHLFQEVAQAAAELLQAQGGAITLVVEEGRFLKAVAASGQMNFAAGQLIPVDNSLLGWVVTHDRPLVSDDMEADPRSYSMTETPLTLKTCAIVPLRSAGVVIGTMSVYNRADGRSFGAYDLHLLQALGDQAVVGLDRAHMLEESRRNERALAAKNRELQRATQLKDEFMSNMSHELRTPLNAIIGFSDLILSEGVGPVSHQQKDFLEAVLRNGRHLLGLINSVLDLSKIEAGRMTLDLAETDIREAITGAVTDTTSLRAAKRQQCAVAMDDVPLMVLADAQRIRQVLFNLLSNASKFTPEDGEIRVAAVRTRAPLPIPGERTNEHTQFIPRDAVWVSVSDSGTGIKSQDVPKLFIEFSQVDSSASRRQQGTGLGLALCKRFVELHGGTIGAESILGKGSSFWFILPAEGPVRRPRVSRPN